MKEGKKKCEKFEMEGRWVNFEPLNRICEIPYCTGNREAALISDYSWQGSKYTWVWVPYDCYYHYYSVDDFAYCAQRENIKWIHVMGGSIFIFIIIFIFYLFISLLFLFIIIFLLFISIFIYFIYYYYY